MLLSLALIFLIGMLFGAAARKLHLPGLIGMLAAGILMGPNLLNMIDGSVLNISSELRQIALVIILMRAGLSLNLEDLKRIGIPAVLMCFVPASCEIAGVLLLAPKLLGITLAEAAVMGSVIAAVSPAVIVPRMITLMDSGWGSEKKIPQLIMAGASVDDVFVIVLFSSFTVIASGEVISASVIAHTPVAVITGIIAGIVCGSLLSVLFRRISGQPVVKLIVLLCVCLLAAALEKTIESAIPFSGLLAVMAVGVTLLKRDPQLAKGFSWQLSQLWTGAEIMLFVLVGATVDLSYAVTAGPMILVLLAGALLFRMAGVFISLLPAALNKRERLFCMIAYLPKATVQAAIGGLPLAMGLPCGKIVLTAAVVSILLTAPLGALGVDLTYRKLLKRN